MFDTGNQNNPMGAVDEKRNPYLGCELRTPDMTKSGRCLRTDDIRDKLRII